METKRYKKLIISFLDILCSDKNKEEQIESLLLSIKKFSGVDAVAIRLKEGNDYPYYITQGFSDEFVKLENYLCSYSLGEVVKDKDGNVILDCMCGAVINSDIDKNLPFFSEGGSFCTNCTTELIKKGLPLEWDRKTRKQCNIEGYESVMCVPLKYHNEVIGTLQLNDKRKDIFNDDLIELYEGIGNAIGIVLKNKEIENLLEKEKETTKNYIDIANVMMISLDMKGMVTFVNKKTCEVLDCSSEDILGKNWIENFIPKEMREDLSIVFYKNINNDNTERMKVESYENPIVTSNGDIRYISWHNSFIKDTFGDVVGTLSSGEDVTEEKEDAKELEALAKELQRSNTELEEFAYIASHDIQEPLRVVTTYCQLLETEYNDKIDEDGKVYMGYITEYITRMQYLIKELLEFSRVGKKDKPTEFVDFNSLVNDVKKDFATISKENKMKIKVSKLPSLNITKVRIRQLFHNLLSNSIKFRNKDKSTNIKISAFELMDCWEFCFKDNGIGINEKYHDRIFQPFKRLYTRDEYPGTGIGLAMCKKIVESHGGKIWVESEKGKGSTFYFTLPKKILQSEKI